MLRMLPRSVLNMTEAFTIALLTGNGEKLPIFEVKVERLNAGLGLGEKEMSTLTKT